MLSRSLCRSCKRDLLTFFKTRLGDESFIYLSHCRNSAAIATQGLKRNIHFARPFPRNYSQSTSPTTENKDVAVELQDPIQSLEAAAREARSAFGDVLPDGFDPEVLEVYTRLFGPPTLVSERELYIRTLYEKFGKQVPAGWLSDEETSVFQKLYGDLEALSDDQESVEFSHNLNDSCAGNETSHANSFTGHDSFEDSNDKTREFDSDDFEATQDPETVRAVHQEMGFEEKPQPLSPHVLQKIKELEEQGLLDERGKHIDWNLERDKSDEEPVPEVTKDDDHLEAEMYLDKLDQEHEDDYIRTHPYTLEGRSGTSPSTLFLPKDTFVEPISAILSNASNKHLTEFAHKTFGGPALPNSVSTPSIRAHLRQKPVALEAGQDKMKAMEANLYLAAMFPGLYACITNILVETRKRLGSEWIEGLLKKPDGARILDAGGGGAGVLAFRDVLRAEWQRIQPEGTINSPMLSKATVVTGSYELRSNISQLLENTSFLPRIPDFSAARDVPGAREYDPKARKQYDIIVAPHSLWSLEEDYMRKSRVQNLWSLLNPNGGVLIILEKGLPRGFELVAGARQTLLEYHIRSPGIDQDIELINHHGSKRTEMETGMIIAPCTNHSACPMYKIPGEMSGRKDFCHFQQRYIRPPFLQRISGIGDRNHEDIRFSYIAVQRGKDLRQQRNIPQNEEATLSALQGFENDAVGPEALSLPRIVLPPLKRHKHVTFNMCTPSAQIERWVMPASRSKAGYRDARKARWGDIWALGAKSRMPLSVRSGFPVKGGKPKRHIKMGTNEDILETEISEAGARPGVRKRNDERKQMMSQKVKRMDEQDI